MIALGGIVGVFSFKGELRVHLHHRESTTLREWRSVLLRAPDGQERPARMRVRSGAGKRILGTVEGVQTEAAAQALIGWEILIARADLPQTGADEYYVEDLLGMPVFDETGAPVGTLEEIAPGHKDIWVIQPESPEADPYFVVAEGGNIASVDVPGRRLVVLRAALSG